MTHLPQAPPGATALRPLWADLPQDVRGLVEDRLGVRVVEAVSQGSGFTHGLASRLLLSDGRRVFVKAAQESEEPFSGFAASAYREEARKLPLLPPGVPAPRLQWVIDGNGWVVLALDDVHGRPPRRPWHPEELDPVLAELDRTARLLTPTPTGLAGERLVDALADEASYWKELHADPLAGAHAQEAGELALAGLSWCDGEGTTHGDLRDDNVLLDRDGQVWFCDWNWPMAGPPWFDTITLLLSARGDDIDTDGLLRRLPLTCDLSADAVDGVLALLAGFWLRVQHDPVPPTSPWIRVHQAWYAHVAYGWLAQRRGWT